MYYLFYLILGLAPSLIWLAFYLRRDAHPEPKTIVLKVFFLGILAAFAAALIENLFFEFTLLLPLPKIISELIYLFLGIALAEELLKYGVVKQAVLKDPEFDEPLDAMIYMIIAALGFAAFENVFIFLSNSPQFFETVLISSLRFIGATLLHTLASATLGFFLAFSFLEPRRARWFLAVGLSAAVLLHGFYNLFIMEIEGELKFGVSFVLLAILFLLVWQGMEKLKKYVFA